MILNLLILVMIVCAIRPLRRYVFERWRKTALPLLLLCLAFVAARLALPLVPLPPGLFADVPVQWKIVDRNGRSLRSVRPDAGPYQQRVNYAEIPQTLVQATLAAEDHRFFKHHGVDCRGLLRAAIQLVVHRRVISGGSTITQQLIKLAEPRPRTFRTKLIECAQALRLEQVWNKQRILSEYLNRLEYGSFVTGCAAASQFYFAKPLRDLSMAEAALLAGLPQAPSRLNPSRYPERSRKRQQWVLFQMFRTGFLTSEEFERGRFETLCFAAPRHPFEAPHFVDLLLQQSADAEIPLGAAVPLVTTTLDLKLNHFAEKTIRQRVSSLRSQDARNAAVVVIDNRSGGVLALVGSENYFARESGQVNGAWAPRSAGSTLKPFTYLLALERGATPATVVADVPTDFATATGVFSPVNYDRHCYGPMRYRLALANSLNISAVKVLASVGGPEPLLERLRACGLSTLTRSAEDYGLGITIGNAEVRLLELANAYACLARLGEYRPYHLLFDGTARNLQSDGARSVADAGAAYLIADILSDNGARALAFGSETPLRFEFPVACKTGTSSDFRDNWAFGYTPEFTVGVWVGNFDGSPMHHVSGITGAGPILHDIFEHLHLNYGTTWYNRPENVVEYSIHPVTGHRVKLQQGELRPHPVIKEKFLTSNLPPFETDADYETGKSHRVLLGSEFQDWCRSAENWLAADAVLAEESVAPRIAFPLPGTTFYLDPDLPGQGRRLYPRTEGGKNLRWKSSTLTVESNGNGQIVILAEGRHTLLVSDPESGFDASTWIEVRAR